MEITIFDSKGRFITMAKKATKNTNSVSEASGAAPARKTVEPRGKKHLKAQAVGVAAAVEGFVHAIVGPASGVVKSVEVEKDAGPVSEIAEPEAANIEAPAQKAEVTHEDISRLAYSYYLNRGGQNGSEADDWARAEHTLRAGAK